MIFLLNAIIVAVCSLAAGFLNGIFGTGGGIILIFLLSKLYPAKARDNFALTIAAVIVMSLISALFYMRNGSIDPAVVVRLLPSAVAGGLLGAFLLDKIKPFLLNKLFAAVVIFGGIYMIVGK